jgi:glycosyltransferase involved in cell wall biosynthesis
MRHIALISDHASPLACLGGVDSGGQNVYVDQLARRLADLGHRVDVFTRRDHPGLPDVVALGPRARVVHVQAGPPARMRKEDLLPYMGEFLERFLLFQGRESYDLVHANFFLSALVAAEAKRVSGTPFVVTFHALGRVRKLHQREADAFPAERTAIEDRAVAEADCIIAECPQDLKDLVRHYGADASRIRTIPCGFDPDEFWPVPRREARAALGIGRDDRVILQLGRMVPRKGVETVIRSLACLREDHGVPARLLVVGGESRDPDPAVTPEIGRLQAIARAVGVERAVTFVGSRDRHELRDYYSAADVFVTTPWYEPFGITPVEAMACGTPVIGSAVGGIKSTVRDGETGYLVRPNDPAALAGRLAQVLLHPALREEFGRRAVRRARERFTWRRVAEDVAKVYAEVLAAPAPQRARSRRGRAAAPLSRGSGAPYLLPMPVSNR